MEQATVSDFIAVNLETAISGLNEELQSSNNIICTRQGAFSRKRA